MALHAATATSDTKTVGVLLLLALIVTFCYLISCWFWPFGACRRCGGTGKRRSPSRRFFGDCRRCDGTGRRIRTGRRVITYIRKNGGKS